MNERREEGPARRRRPRRRLRAAAGGRRWQALSSCGPSHAERVSVSLKSDAINVPLSASCSVEITSKAVETLRCARSGGPGPSAETAVTRDRRDRERAAERVRFAVGAEVCGAVGCSRSDGLMCVVVDGESRTLCPVHLRRWSA